ncbi:MAG: M48 family metallopeptidase, partial [Paracoccaceae bacterium]|nr:M48 family metallopeptidase [Paracoccaceae bacterium]
REKEAWIRAALAARPVGRAVAMGGTVPIEGVECTIRPGTGRAPRLEGGALLVPGDTARAGARVAAYLKVLARARLQEACDRHASALGRGYSGLTLRDTKSRWGSCSADGALMFSWRLVMAPPAVLDYVAAHEVAHLAEMNHSARFWAKVARLMPEYEGPRAWLKRHGQELHSVMFAE